MVEVEDETQGVITRYNAVATATTLLALAHEWSIQDQRIYKRGERDRSAIRFRMKHRAPCDVLDALEEYDERAQYRAQQRERRHALSLTPLLPGLRELAESFLESTEGQQDHVAIIKTQIFGKFITH